MEHECVLDKNICLLLNANWIPISLRTVKQTVTAMMSESNGETPLLALDIELDQEGKINYANPLSWDEWSLLPIREGDLFIQTKDKQIRVPTVAIARFYKQIPTHTIRWSTGNVHRRDNYTCAYTGEKLSHATATVDHILPRSRGGRDSWENTVSCHRRVNVLKSNRTPHEAGLRLLRKPKAPPTLPVIITAADAKHPSQTPFLL